ncbi:hypothetical protein [Weeksella virosa]|uniref:Uncharacterized protein n=1 Tax=Weeksella virosa (strain ATCC 43766 / DSM 16922 / JCM 21250 / CCUG 30538 / CDC 9751 / IAM 14551 / NBRC 16016 / NCTC 11634 / CL345/78) TaxID=865938 RepID=F0P2E6_WEEVC|nr:hypothetical protein [Weeksella virosa]ADX66758.1 hypothetical protein Weevi_0030 [Weeksella virosa DSM 16922]SUP53023.1 Uncharacterised protein [Weeksella virosa]VEH63519.1 Uncharacterised protein [Weeksella virosa]
MKTKKIKYLEFLRAELINEQKNKNNNQDKVTIQEIENKIQGEQKVLWNYYLQNPIDSSNYDELEDIIRYFDQINYKNRIYEKILVQKAELNSLFDKLIIEQAMQEAKKIELELNRLCNLINEKCM